MALLRPDGKTANDPLGSALPVDAKQLPWFMAEVPEPPEEFRDILEANGIAPSEARQHIQSVRDKAWASLQYPCIGHCIFLESFMSQNAAFPRVLEVMRAPSATLVDIGCGFGQDLRTLAARGIAASQLTGIDLNQIMIDLGYEMFNDRDTFRGNFQVGDMLKLSTSHPHLIGSFDVVHAACALHLFDYETQKVACENAVKLLKPGGLLVGEQMGQHKASSATWTSGIFINDETTFRKLFEIVGEKLNLVCNVSVQMRPLTGQSESFEAVNPGRQVIQFCVQILPK